MEKYKVILTFQNSDREIESVLLDKKPTKEKAEEDMNFYKADGFRIETVTLFKYAIAIFEINGDNKVYVVYATDEVNAIVEAVEKFEKENDMEFDWGIEKDKLPFNTVEEALDFYLQGELIVSEPVEI